MSHIIRLNNQQSEIVSLPADSFVVVRALAGCTKSTVIKHRVFKLLLDRTESSSKICVLAFNKSIADELSNFFNDSVERKDQRRLIVKTFHGLAYQLVLANYKKLGFEEKPAIQDNRRLADYINEIHPAIATSVIKLALEIEARAAGFGVSIQEMCEHESIKYLLDLQKLKPEWIDRVCVLMQQAKKMLCLISFHDLLTYANELPDEVFSKLNISDVLVDEMQDLNVPQQEILMKLLSTAKGFTGVGDQWQNIYSSFSGANIHVFDRIAKEYPHTINTNLTYNYRSSIEVLDLVNAFITKSFGKSLNIIGLDRHSARPLIITKSKMLDWLLDRSNEGEFWKDIAILYRTRKDLPEIETALVEAGIPYSMSDTSFFDNPYIQDIMAFFNVLYNPNANLVEHVFRVSKILMYSKDSAKHDWEAHKQDFIKYQDGRLRECLIGLMGHSSSLVEIFNYIDELVKLWWANINPDAVEQLKENSEAFEYWIQTTFTSDKHTGWDVVNKVEELKFDKALVTDNYDCVTLTTVHKAKGLQWNSVMIYNVSEDNFPHKRGDYDEEKRIFYVAMTRAKNHLVFVRHPKKELSPFLVGESSGRAIRPH